MSMHRYVRWADIVYERCGPWHEMCGGDDLALCGERLVPMPMDRDASLAPLKFQMVGGMGFPGVACEDCRQMARWRDELGIFPLHDTAELTT